MVKFVQANRLGNQAAEERVTRNLIDPVSSHLSFIDDKLLHFVESEIDISALRKEHLPDLAIPSHRNRKISDLTEEQAVEWTRLTTPELTKLAICLRLQDNTFQLGHTGRQNRIAGEELLLIGLVRICTGLTFGQMVSNVFGGGITRLCEAFDFLIDYVFTTFFHKISGNSLSKWVPSVSSFRDIFWDKVTSNPCKSETWM